MFKHVFIIQFLNKKLVLIKELKNQLVLSLIKLEMTLFQINYYKNYILPNEMI